MTDEMPFRWRFDPEHSQVALVTSDNRIKIWNSQTLRLVAECIQPNHLDAQYTCLCWIQLSNSKKRSKKENEKGNWLGLALGTHSGQIILWDISKAEVHKSWKAHSMPINDIVYSKNSNSLYSCSGDQTIIQWDAATADQQHAFKRETYPIHRLCLNHQETVLASASTSIKLWDLSSKKILKKLQGHSQPISSLKFSLGDQYLISCTKDRFISLWDCSTDSESKQGLQVFSSDHNPVYLDFCHTSNSNEKTDYFMAVTELGSVNIWKFNKSNLSSKSIPPCGKISCEKDKVLGSEFISDSQVLILYGNLIKPQFTTLKIFDENHQVIESQTIEASKDSSLISKSEKKKKSKLPEPEILDSTHQPRLQVKDSQLEEENDKTIEEKLDMMETEANETEETDTTQKSQIIPKADSLQSILTQAIKTNDDTLLESVLAVSDPIVIKNTVQRLPPKFILPFLKSLVDRFQSKPTRSQSLLVWIQTVLKLHTSYLMTVPDLVKILSSLYSLVDSRVSTFKKMMSLSGRLDLLLTQISSHSNEEDQFVPKSVYVEEDDEEEGEEDSNPMEEEIDE